MTNQRMYRADHLIPEGPSDIAVGKSSETSIVGSTLLRAQVGVRSREGVAKPTTARCAAEGVVPRRGEAVDGDVEALG